MPPPRPAYRGGHIQDATVGHGYLPGLWLMALHAAGNALRGPTGVTARPTDAGAGRQPYASRLRPVNNRAL